MNAFADTNWLEALYLKPDPENRSGMMRKAIAERRMRHQREPLLISHIVLLEARNVFSRVTGQRSPIEWEDLLSDFNGRLFVDPMNWDILRQATNRIFEQFSYKVVIGTFDATLIASAQLAGALELLSFDETLKALASALDIKVFPELRSEGKTLLAKLRAERSK